jgi:putative transposase
MLVAERFIIASLINKFGKCPVSTDGWGTLYPQACQFLDIEHHIYHSSFEKSIIIERTIQYIKIELKDLMIIFHVKRRSIN